MANRCAARAARDGRDWIELVFAGPRQTAPRNQACRNYFQCLKFDTAL